MTEEKIVQQLHEYEKKIIKFLQNKKIASIEEIQKATKLNKDAVEKAYQIALDLNGSIVLFSPGATSFSMFNNEFHRGEEFNKVIYQL